MSTERFRTEGLRVITCSYSGGEACRREATQNPAQKRKKDHSGLSYMKRRTRTLGVFVIITKGGGMFFEDAFWAAAFQNALGEGGRSERSQPREIFQEKEPALTKYTCLARGHHFLPIGRIREKSSCREKPVRHSYHFKKPDVGQPSRRKREGKLRGLRRAKSSYQKIVLLQENRQSTRSLTQGQDRVAVKKKSPRKNEVPKMPRRTERGRERGSVRFKGVRIENQAKEIAKKRCSSAERTQSD